MLVRLKRGASAVALYYLFGLLVIVLDYTRLRTFGQTSTFWSVAVDDLPWWTLYAFAMPPIFWIVTRFPLKPGRLQRDVVYYLGAISAAAAVHTVLTALFARSQWYIVSAGVIFNNIFSDVFYGTILIALLLGVQYFKTSHENSMRAAEVERALARAELEKLNEDAQPALLLTTLSAIAQLAGDDPERTEDAIVMLSEFLRNVLQRGAPSDVPLERDVPLLDKFAAILGLVSSGRCAIRLHISEDVRLALIPPMLCQGVLHEPIARALSQGTALDVIVRATREGDKVLFRFQTAHGVVLETKHRDIADRLSTLYGGDASLAIDDEDSIVLSIPFRRSSGIDAKPSQAVSTGRPSDASRPQEWVPPSRDRRPGSYHLG